MTTEAAPSSSGTFSRWLSSTPMKATTRPARAAESSKTTVNRLGSLPLRIAASTLREPRLVLKARQATVNDMVSKTIDRPSTM